MPDVIEQRELVEKLAEEFVRRYRNGERPSLAEYAQAYPAHADEINDLFPALVMMEDLAPSDDSVAGFPVPSALAPVPTKSAKWQRIGDYTLLREIGRGGMGVVYEAEQLSLSRRVAVKVLTLPPGENTTVLERFRREARAAAQLHHTNIVPVYEVGQDGDHHYYAMQLIVGQGLDEVIGELRELRAGRGGSSASERANIALSLLTAHFEAPDLAEGPEARDEGRVTRDETQEAKGERPEVQDTDHNGDLAPHLSSFAPHPSPLTSHSSPLSEASAASRGYYQSAARIGVQVAEALVYAHQRGIIHRDIKPSNLLLDTAGVVWVTDFGLAKTQDSGLTQAGDIVGTVRYMAPERFRRVCDRRADVYSLGLTLYELITLVPAFESADRLLLIDQIGRQEARRPRSLDPRIPRDLETIVLKAIEKEPARRYRTAEELANDLRRFLEDRPIRARRSSRRERLWRWCRRNPVVAGLLTLVALLLTAVAGVSLFAAVQLDQALDQTRKAEREARLREAEALVGQAHGTRLSRRPGQRFEALDALGKATAIGRELGQPPGWFDRLRNEAIAALALPDLHITQEFGSLPPGNAWVELSENFKLYAQTTENGGCTVRRVVDDGEIALLPELGEPAEAFFGPGLILAVRGTLSNRFQLWDLSGDKPARRIDERRITNNLAFHPQGHQLALGHAAGTIAIHDIASGACLKRFSAKEKSEAGLCFHPTAPFLASFWYNSHRAWIYDLRTGVAVASVPGPGPRGNGCGAWSPDGRTFLVPSGDSGKIQEYAFDAAAATFRPMRTLPGPAGGGYRVTYNPAGDRFVSRGWDGAVQLFDAVSGQVLFSTDALPAAGCRTLRFDRTGQRLAAARVGNRQERVGLWSVGDAREYRALVPAGDKVVDSELIFGPAAHPGGRVAALGFTDGVVLFDLKTGRELAHLPITRRHTSLSFDGTGRLLTNGFEGLFRWPVRPDPANAGRLLVGPPEKLPFNPGEREIAASKDGRVVAQCMFAAYGMERFAGGWILHPRSPTPRRVDAGRGMVSCAVSPDGCWVAFGGHATRIDVFDAATGKRVWQSPTGQGNDCRFNLDGRWLVTSVDGGRIYAGNTWERGPRLGPGTPWGVTKDVAVLGQSNGTYRLVELATGRELARLESPQRSNHPAALTPDGTKLVVAAKNGLRVWDLRRMRQELRKLDLDWEAPPYPPIDQERDLSPLQVTVDLGELMARKK